MTTVAPQTLAPLIGVAIAAAVMGLRLSRARKTRPLKLEGLLILPILLASAAGFLLWQMPPRGLEWLALGLALLVGAALGWQRGRMMTITVDPETHALNQQASPAALAFLFVLIAVRIVMRQGVNAEAAALHLSAAFITDVFVVFAVGMLGVTRLEMFVRARRLLDEARNAGRIVS